MVKKDTYLGKLYGIISDIFRNDIKRVESISIKKDIRDDITRRKGFSDINYIQTLTHDEALYFMATYGFRTGYINLQTNASTSHDEVRDAWWKWEELFIDRSVTDGIDIMIRYLGMYHLIENRDDFFIKMVGGYVFLRKNAVEDCIIANYDMSNKFSF